MARNIPLDVLLKAIKNSQAIISTVQTHLRPLGYKVDWHTVQRAINKHPQALQAMQDEQETILDIAENKVMKEILQGDVHTAKWYLKMKGQSRGYIEQQNLNLGGSDPLNINLGGDMMSAQDNLEAGNVEMPDYGEEPAAED